MKITDHIDNWKKKRQNLSFAFLAERCPTSEDAPFRIKPSSPILPEETCVLVLAEADGREVNLRGYNSILKKTDNFVKNNIDTQISPVCICVAVCDFGKKHIDRVARTGAYLEHWNTQSWNELKHSIPELRRRNL